MQDAKQTERRTGLVITRKEGEVVNIITSDGVIDVALLRVKSRTQVQLRFAAPRDVRIERADYKGKVQE